MVTWALGLNVTYRSQSSSSAAPNNSVAKMLPSDSTIDRRRPCCGGNVPGGRGRSSTMWMTKTFDGARNFGPFSFLLLEPIDNPSLSGGRLSFLHRRHDEKKLWITLIMRCYCLCKTTRPSSTRDGEVVTFLQEMSPREIWRHRDIILWYRVESLDVFTVLRTDLHTIISS